MTHVMFWKKINKIKIQGNHLNRQSFHSEQTRNKVFSIEKATILHHIKKQSKATWLNILKIMYVQDDT